MKCLFLLLCMVPALVRSEILNRCVGTDSHVSYQSQPCARGMRLDKSIEYTPDAAVTKPTRIKPPNVASRYRIRGQQPRSVRNASRQMAAVDRCRVAKAKREEALQNLGMKRTYDQLSKLDAPVRKACNGF